ncbi:hypothetical protein SAMCCGM7_Ch3582 [Sinorhizobium americanum CCGM7]|nr:hypothetical protein SAMCCGM7_Ch3582 [Sinorhizobium americanum CCGM7]
MLEFAAHSLGAAWACGMRRPPNLKRYKSPRVKPTHRSTLGQP